MTDGNRASVPLLVLDKITDILDVFSLSRPEHTLASIRETTGLPASTAQRLVDNLVAHGFLDRTVSGYRVGLRMSYWAAPAVQGIDLVDIVKPALIGLRDTVDETACFFQTSLDYRVCVAIAETRHLLRRTMHVGRILPLHAGSAGRVLLAWDDALAARVLSSRLEPVTDGTITDRKALRAAVEQTRADGFAITTGERESGSSGLSAPVFNAQADLVGAVTIMGPTLRMPRERCEQWVELLVETAERVTRTIGGRHPAEAPGLVG